VRIPSVSNRTECGIKQQSTRLSGTLPLAQPSIGAVPTTAEGRPRHAWGGPIARSSVITTGVTGSLIITLAASLAACSSSASRSPAPTPPAVQLTRTQIAALGAPATFSTPPAVGEIIQPISANRRNLASYGYAEKEYFASGTAYALKPTAMPDSGKWTFTPTTPAHYETRVIVRLPTDPAKFDGNVVVEWMNVSAGESAPDWDYANPTLMDEGAAYVGVSEQALAVNGGQSLLGTAATRPSPGLRGDNPARYGMLHHPGDQYALDMFAQIGEALRQPQPAILGGLQPTHVLATGESQSAFYLTSYANALQPVVPGYQGLFIHSRGGGAVPLGGANVKAALKAQSVRIRTDLSAPVLMFQTQTDLIQLGYAPARQPNTARIRTWEVAGTSHADAYELGGAAGLIGCTTPVNDGPQHEVIQAAFLAWLHWVDTDTPPPSPPPFRLSAAHPATLALDAHGNVVGGVRTPAVDVPVSTLAGAPPRGATRLCGLFGSAVPFTTQQLQQLYGTPSNFMATYTKALDEAIAKGYLIPSERAAMLTRAQQVRF